MTNENTKKTADAATKAKNSQKPAPVRVFRMGAVAASVWQRQTSTGFAYYDFSLSRSWKSSASGREGYSTSFFPQNGEALTEVIRQAADWVNEQMVDSGELAEDSPTHVRQAA